MLILESDEGVCRSAAPAPEFCYQLFLVYLFLLVTRTIMLKLNCFNLTTTVTSEQPSALPAAWPWGRAAQAGARQCRDNLGKPKMPPEQYLSTTKTKEKKVSQIWPLLLLLFFFEIFNVL